MKSHLLPTLLASLVLAAACAPGPAPTAVATEPALTAVVTESTLACTQIGQVWVAPGDGMTLVCVPAGEFLMGAAEEDTHATADEKPQHTVYLDAYWIDQTEVSNAQFAACLAAGACQPINYETTAQTYVPYAVNPFYADYPALIYNSEDAVAYCAWAGRRLPSEAEWEKAARGIDGRLYPWGNELDPARISHGRLSLGQNPDPQPTRPACGNALSCGTAPVTAYPEGASPYGALNMTGNVWEWVADWYAADYYQTSPERNPTGPAQGDYRARRGGGWRSMTRDLRLTARSGGVPQHYLDGQIGFRCALSPSP